MLNSYTFEVYRKNDKPCFVVTINHIMRKGVYFFNTLNEARHFIDENKKELSLYAPLIYNPDNIEGDKIIILIKTVLSCDNICIGENGKTYFNGKI